MHTLTKNPLAKYNKISLKEELKDLEQELEDAQQTHDDDEFNFKTAQKHFIKSQSNLSFAHFRLVEFKKKHNLK